LKSRTTGHFLIVHVFPDMGFVPIDPLAFTKITEPVPKDGIGGLRGHGAIRKPKVGVHRQKQEINKSVAKEISLAITQKQETYRKPGSIFSQLSGKFHPG
jgi:hypothetical protein